MMYDNETFIQSTASASGLGTTIDLSTGTEINTGLKGGSTSLGTTSTMQAAAVHGNINNSDFDAYCNFVNIGEIPDNGQRTLSVTLTVGTLPDVDPNGNACLMIIVSAIPRLENVRGYSFGIMRTATGSGTDKATQYVSRFGSNPSAGAELTGTPVRATMSAVFDQSGEGMVAAVGIARGADSGFQDSATLQDVTAETFSDVYVGVAMTQVAASPSTTVTWAGVTLTYSWT
jgi:hypothetical protein|tara:strand:- start:326 stop:1018 length:693 start_codon:yes stop_codon:yes gene_type:complete